MEEILHGHRKDSYCYILIKQPANSVYTRVKNMVLDSNVVWGFFGYEFQSKDEPRRRQPLACLFNAILKIIPIAHI